MVDGVDSLVGRLWARNLILLSYYDFSVFLLAG